MYNFQKNLKFYLGHKNSRITFRLRISHKQNLQSFPVIEIKNNHVYFSVKVN